MLRLGPVFAALFIALFSTPGAAGATLPTVPAHQIPLPAFAQPKVIGQPIPHPPPNGLGTHAAEQGGWWKGLWTDPVATFTMAVAFFTLCLVAVSAYQGKQLSRTATIAARAAEDAEKAMQAARDNANAAAAQAQAMDSLRITAEAQQQVMQEQAKAMATVAEAARQSAEVARQSLTELERPYVVVEVTEPGIDVDAEGNFSFARSQPRWEALNFGRTPAILLDRLTRWFVERDGTMPYPIDPIKQRGQQFPVGCIAAADHAFGETHNYMADLPRVEEILTPGAWRTWRIFFVGYVRYIPVQLAQVH